MDQYQNAQYTILQSHRELVFITLEVNVRQIR